MTTLNHEQRQAALALIDGALLRLRKNRAIKIPDLLLSNARRKPQPAVPILQTYKLPEVPTGVKPKNAKLAMDEASVELYAWASTMATTGAFSEGLGFLGYTYLAELAQRPEYRRISERIATEMTRKWIKLQSAGDEDKSEKIKLLEKALKKFQVRRVFREAAEQDGFFGRSHIHVDLGADETERKSSILDANGVPSKAKIAKGKLKGLRTIEPVWCYPAMYNATDPLAADWYKPNDWYVMGKQIHVSRLIPIVGREVPDLLKPAYSFGGLSLSQMAKPYVDNWLRTRQSVADLIHNFSVFVLSTNMGATTLGAGGDEFFRRLELFNLLRDNQGVLAVDKDGEGLENVSAPLGTLDMLQAQTQEHMAAVSGIPITILLGITPAGLNASSEGEIRAFYDWILSYQELLFADPLKTVIDVVQLHEFGEIDPDITFSFEPLWSLDEKAKAEVRKLDVETSDILIANGTLRPEEERKRVANDPDTPYPGLDVDDVPEVEPEEEALLVPGEGEGEQPPGNGKLTPPNGAKRVRKPPAAGEKATP